mgnify:CR=1 FL=1
MTAYTQSYLALEQQVAVGYHNDVDLAVKFRNPHNSIDKALETMATIEEELKVCGDVVPLNVADSIIKYRFTAEGYII